MVDGGSAWLTESIVAACFNCFICFLDMAFPAHVAAYGGDLEHLRMLVDNHIVNFNERDDKGSTPAHKGILVY